MDRTATQTQTIDSRAEWVESLLRLWLFYLAIPIGVGLLMLKPYGDMREREGSKRMNTEYTRWLFEFHGNCVRKGGMR